MKPVRGFDIINIPITFDAKGGYMPSKSGKGLGLFLVLVIWLFISVLVVLVGHSWGKWLFPPIGLFVASYIVRFAIFRERFFKAKRKELQENEFMFDHTIFWNIYEVGSKFPYIVKFGNGMRGIFVALDKDVIVGRDKNHDYDHHEAIAEAYKQLTKAGMECMHIDYMDTVGKDDRMDFLFEEAENTKNEELRKVILRMYDHTMLNMNRAYASYDVYCFYSYSREDLFWDELQSILQYFRQANYIRARVLNRDAIATLVESVMNLSDFSVNRANDGRLMNMNSLTQYIRPIWVEHDGEREVLNKTMEEIAEAKRVLQAEKSIKRRKGARRRIKKGDDIDLFNSSGVDDYNPAPPAEAPSTKVVPQQESHSTSLEDEDEIEI